MDYLMQISLDAFLADDDEEKVICGGFFDAEELAIFSRLIRGRRPLPTYHGDCWRCYDCLFESSSFRAMAEHIMRAHKPGRKNEVLNLEAAG